MPMIATTTVTASANASPWPFGCAGRDVTGGVTGGVHLIVGGVVGVVEGAGSLDVEMGAGGITAGCQLPGWALSQVRVMAEASSPAVR